MKIVEKCPTMEQFDHIVIRWKEQLMQGQTDTNELVFRLRDFVQKELDISRIKLNRWIPCSERLPEDFAWCLVCMSDGCIRLGKWNGEYDEQGVWWVSHPNSGGKLYRIKNVPFWMQLPEPPKEDET